MCGNCANAIVWVVSVTCVLDIFVLTLLTISIRNACVFNVQLVSHISSSLLRFIYHNITTAII